MPDYCGENPLTLLPFTAPNFVVKTGRSFNGRNEGDWTAAEGPILAENVAKPPIWSLRRVEEINITENGMAFPVRLARCNIDF